MARYSRRRRYCRFTAEGCQGDRLQGSSTPSGSTSRRPARSSRAASPALGRAINAGLRGRSSGPVFSRSSPTATHTGTDHPGIRPDMNRQRTPPRARSSSRAAGSGGCPSHGPMLRFRRGIPSRSRDLALEGREPARPPRALPSRGAVDARPAEFREANAVRSLLTFVMRGRVHVITACAVCSVFSLLLFPLNYVSGALLGLATLRNGAVEGALRPARLDGAGGSVHVCRNRERSVPAVLLALLSWTPLWLHRARAEADPLPGRRPRRRRPPPGGRDRRRAHHTSATPPRGGRTVLEEFFSWLAVSSDWGPFIGPHRAPHDRDRGRGSAARPRRDPDARALVARGARSARRLRRGVSGVPDAEVFRVRDSRALRPSHGSPSGWVSDLAYEWLMILIVLFGLQGIALVHYVVKWRNASVACGSSGCMSRSRSCRSRRRRWCSALRSPGSPTPGLTIGGGSEWVAICRPGASAQCFTNLLLRTPIRSW